MDHNSNCCLSIDSFKYNIYSDISKCESILELSNCEDTKSKFRSILSHLQKILKILDSTEKKELKKHTMNLRPRKNKVVTGVEVIGEAPPYPFYNFSL